MGDDVGGDVGGDVCDAASLNLFRSDLATTRAETTRVTFHNCKG